MKVKIIALLVLLSLNVRAQKTKNTGKYNFGISTFVGHSFPNYLVNENRWKGKFYSAGGLIFLIQNKLSKKISTEVGLGMSFYALVNKGPVDNYVFDLVSPHLTTAIQYLNPVKKNVEGFIKLSTGWQVGYQGSFTDYYDRYQVQITARNSFYFFVLPEIGIRNKVFTKINQKPQTIYYEISSYFRYNLNSLGEAKFIESNYVTIAEPKGNVIGINFKILFPFGKMLTYQPEERSKPSL